MPFISSFVGSMFEMEKKKEMIPSTSSSSYEELPIHMTCSAQRFDRILRTHIYHELNYKEKLTFFFLSFDLDHFFRILLHFKRFMGIVELRAKSVDMLTWITQDVIAVVPAAAATFAVIVNLFLEEFYLLRHWQINRYAYEATNITHINSKQKKEK